MLYNALLGPGGNVDCAGCLSVGSFVCSTRNRLPSALCIVPNVLYNLLYKVI
jgi:hypothetical protein